MADRVCIASGCKGDALKNDSLCLFHATDKDPEDFRRAFLALAVDRARGQEPLDATGFVFPENFRLQRVEFRTALILYQARFLGDVRLSAVVFYDDVDLTEASVDGSLKIQSCEFRQSLVIDQPKLLSALTITDSRIDVNLLLPSLPLSAAVEIVSSTVRGDVMCCRQAGQGPSGSLVFRSATVNDLILPSLQGTTTMASLRVKGNFVTSDSRHLGHWRVEATAIDGDCTASGATFDHDVNVGMTCKGRVSFRKATFHGVAAFTESEFYGPVNFYHVTVDEIDFSHSYFGSRMSFVLGDALNTRGAILFQHVVFTGPVHVDAKLSTSRRLSFRGSVFAAGCLVVGAWVPPQGKSPLLECEGVFVQPGHVIRIAPDHASDDEPLRIGFRKADVHRFQLDVKTTQPAVPRDSATDGGEFSSEDLIDLYRGLRLTYERHLRYPEAGSFFSKEMDERRRATRNRFVRLLFWIYRSISGYGESYFRPLLALVLWILLVGLWGSGTLVPAWSLDGLRETLPAVRTVFHRFSFSQILLTGLAVVTPFAPVPGKLAWPAAQGAFIGLARLVAAAFAALAAIGLRRTFQRRPGED